MIHIMLPAYNEAAALPDLLDSIREVEWPDGDKYNVVVVDDGSTDGTVSVCRSRWDCMPLEVSCHVANQGLGTTMLTGLKYCVSRCGPDDVVIAMDADNTHSPALMPSMVRRIRSGSDIVIASRYAPGGREMGLSTKRKILSRGASTMLRVAFGIPGARDYTCGYRAYSASILERGFNAFSDNLIEQRGFVCMAELLIKLGSLGAKISEAPLVLRYDRKAGASKMNISNTIGSYFKLITVNRPRVPENLTFAEVGRAGGSTPDDIEEQALPMITVIHLRDSAFVGGPEKQILGQSVRLDRSLFDRVIVSFSASGENALTEAAEAEGIPTECLPDGKLSLFGAVGRLAALLRQSPNPVVISSGFKADFVAKLACGRLRVPWIAWFHGFTAASPRVRVYECLDMRALKHAQCVVAICERTAARLRACGLPNVVVVPNGIDAAAAQAAGDRQSARLELGISDCEPAVGVVSRLSREKGIDLFIQWAAEVLRTYPQARFPVIGDGPMQPALRQQAESLGIAERIIFTGMREDAVGLMKALDVFVLPSHRENLPVALLEAMACGVSVVATDVGGVGDVLAGTPAEPIPPGSARAITQAVSELLDDRVFRKAQAAALLRRVQDFSFEHHVTLMNAILGGFCDRVAASVTRTEAACQSGGRPYRGD